MATWCRETARCHIVQTVRAMPRGADGPRDGTAYRETERCHVAQRVHAMPHGAERPRDATSCRRTARRYSIQRNRAMPRHAEGPRVQRKIVQIDVDVDRSTTGRFGPASGRTGRALTIPPHTRRRQTDSEYAECNSLLFRVFCFHLAISDDRQSVHISLILVHCR